MRFFTMLLSLAVLVLSIFCGVETGAALALIVAWPIAPSIQTRVLFGWNGAQLGYRNALTCYNKTAVRYGGPSSPVLCGRGRAVPSGRSVLRCVITNGGTAYTGAEGVTIAAPTPGGITATATLTFAAGVVTGVKITNPGIGYTVVPAVTIAASGGAGVQATAYAVMSSTTTYPQPFPKA